MKKFLVVWLPLLILLLGGLGVGFWFLRDTPAKDTNTEQQATIENTQDYPTKSMSEVMAELSSIKGLVPYLGAETTALFELETSKIVFFAPNEQAIQTFSKDTAVLPSKVMPYHIVIGETTAPIVAENTRLKTKDGQELTIVKKDANLFVRDAKGNDVRLRKPIQTLNGQLYIIDKVLLTQ